MNGYCAINDQGEFVDGPLGNSEGESLKKLQATTGLTGVRLAELGFAVVKVEPVRVSEAEDAPSTSSGQAIPPEGGTPTKKSKKAK